MSAFELAIRLIREEYERAASDNPSFNSAHEGYAVLLEEVDELWDEVKANRGSTSRAGDEAVQIGAMAVRYLVDVVMGRTTGAPAAF